MALALLDLNGDEVVHRQQQFRIFRDRENPMENLSREQFQYRYRDTKEIAADLCNLLQDELNRPTRRSQALPVSLQLCIALKYFATGSFQQGTGDIHGCTVPQCKVVHKVSAAICKKRHLYIKFPNNRLEAQAVKEGLYAASDFPNVLGAIDGTLIPIKTPVENEPLFVCRKGYHALNIQGTCNSNMEFTDIVVKFPGSTHDAYIWRTSELCHKFETGMIRDGWLLGDSGYPLQPWLLTPLAHPAGRGEERFNRRHKAARCIVERAFGLLKIRF